VSVYLILGAGKFGRLAVHRLPSKDAGAGLVVVDQDPRALKEARAEAPHAVTWIQAEAIGYLVEHLQAVPPWDWLLPMLPVHLAYEWLRRGGGLEGGWLTVPVPEALEALAPVAFRGKEGQLYLSRARHLCPDDCPEPPEGCPVSGRHWERPLFAELGRLALPGWHLVVIRSRQLAPGIGGYPPQVLWDLAEQAKQVPPGEGLLVGTACACHGVVHAVMREQ